MPLRISAAFDSGSVELIAADDPQHIRLAIRCDSHAEFRQWFHFRLQGARDHMVRLCFENAGECTYADGWNGYQVLASYDRRNWFRIADTRYDGKTLSWAHMPEADSVWYAYFEPYSHERHLDVLGRVQASGIGRLVDLGPTVEGRDLDAIFFEAASAAPNVWIIARQHPGEPMAEWFCEGLIERLIDRADPVARRVRALANLHLVPNANPDGAVRGNLRTNAAGANLNREWASPSAERSPEVLAIRDAMDASGCDLFLDIHGDETLPYVFADGCGMLPGRTAAQNAAEARFIEQLLRASPDFQRTHGYAPDRFSDELLTLASKQIGHRFGCVSLTLEMPFKDNADLPSSETGWNGARSKRLGMAMLLPILDALEQLQGRES